MKFIIISLLSLIQCSIIAQTMSKEQYVAKFYQLAIQEMNLYKIPASITLAQGLIETSNGNSDLCTKAYNHFGIKCQNSWTGMKFIKDDDTKDECFRAYNNAEESFRDHSTFLLRPRYEKLFTNEISDYKSWAYGLKEAGYATNPQYPQMLIKHIEELKLYQFDKYGQQTQLPKEITPNIDSSLIKKNDTQKSHIEKNKKNNLQYVIVDEIFNLTDLSIKTGIQFKKLIEFNELLNEQSLQIGQNFFLEPKLLENSLGFHEVKKGESIYDISQIYGITSSALRKFNKIENWEQPMSGELIFLNKQRQGYLKTRHFYELDFEKSELIRNTKIKENTEVKNFDKKWIEHTVLSSETIFRLGKIYGCTPNEILVWNNLKVEDAIRVGQKLKILTNVVSPVNKVEPIIPSTTIIPTSNKPNRIEVYKRQDGTLFIPNQTAPLKLEEKKPINPSEIEMPLDKKIDPQPKPITPSSGTIKMELE